jgi:hypothetical protein
MITRTNMNGAGTRRGRDGLLVSLGAALVLIVLLVVQSLIGSGLLSTKTVTVTLTTSNAYEQVASAYASHVAELDSINIPALASGYQRNATVEWVGMVPGMVGTYSSEPNIEILWGSFLGKFINFSVSKEHQSIGVEGNVSVVNSTFDFRAYSSIVGNVNGSVIAQDVYGHVGSSWLISRETWNFTQFDEQFFVR